MFRKIASPPGNDTRHVLIARKRIRAQARADAIVHAAQSRAERLLHTAQAEAERLVETARDQTEAAISRGYAAGLSGAFDALRRYWLDSAALNDSLRTTLAEHLCTALQQKLGNAAFVGAMIAEIRLQANTPDERHIHISLPREAAHAVQALQHQWAEAGVRADVVEHANPHALSIRWGPHHWTFDASAFAQDLITQALADATDGPLNRRVAEQQSAHALRALADRLDPPVRALDAALPRSADDVQGDQSTVCAPSRAPSSSFSHRLSSGAQHDQ